MVADRREERGVLHDLAARVGDPAGGGAAPVALEHGEEARAAGVVEPLGGAVGDVDEVAGEEDRVDVADGVGRDLEVRRGVDHRLVVAGQQDVEVLARLGGRLQAEGAGAGDLLAVAAHDAVGHALARGEPGDDALVPPDVAVDDAVGLRGLHGDVGLVVLGDLRERPGGGVERRDARVGRAPRRGRQVGDAETADAVTHEDGVVGAGELGEPDDGDAVGGRRLQEGVGEEAGVADRVGPEGRGARGERGTRRPVGGPGGRVGPGERGGGGQRREQREAGHDDAPGGARPPGSEGRHRRGITFRGQRPGRGVAGPEHRLAPRSVVRAGDAVANPSRAAREALAGVPRSARRVAGDQIDEGRGLAQRRGHAVWLPLARRSQREEPPPRVSAGVLPCWRSI